MFSLTRELSIIIPTSKGPSFEEELREEITSVAYASGALDLRLARLLAWFKRQNLAPLGWQSYTAFCKEKVAWGSTWLRKLVRLAEADLPLVKAAVCSGVLPISHAVRALGQAEDDEEKWLAEALRGRFPRSERPEERFDVAWISDEIEPIIAARELARLLIGRNVSNDKADRFVRNAWKKQLPTVELVEAARQIPPAPIQGPIPPWPEDDPATILVGPWRTPVDLQDGLALLDVLQQARRLRIVRLAAVGKRGSICWPDATRRTSTTPKAPTWSSL
jgi:hypothetical protein